MKKGKEIRGHREYPGYGIGRDGTLYGKNGKKRKLTPDGRGYVRAVLSHGAVRKTVYMHRLVWEVYVGEIPEGMEIDHVDHDASNNELGNLQLVDHRRNIGRSVAAGRRYDIGIEGRRRRRAVVRILGSGRKMRYGSITEAAGRTGWDAGNICRAARGKLVAYGSRWEYADDV